VSWSFRAQAAGWHARGAADSLDGALDAAAAALRDAPRGGAVEAGYKRFDPGEVVAVRLELRRGRRVHGGLDRRGDGSLEAWTGWLRKRPVAPLDGEDAFGALRRTLAQRTSVEP
jgi:hypothetical protein